MKKINFSVKVLEKLATKTYNVPRVCHTQEIQLTKKRQSDGCDHNQANPSLFPSSPLCPSFPIPVLPPCAAEAYVGALTGASA